MALLKYKTRGDSTPSGKAKIFFCCHPDDFDLYFEKICKDILDICNCAIYYYSIEGDETSDLIDFSLQQMNLFVIPITQKLLFTWDEEVERELGVARNSHISILPLMKENGIVKSFQEKFGKIQYLNAYKKDDTAIAFQDKLKTFVESVIYGDELAQKIRDAFDAYIFLSYRKKDRREANKLMRLIHENEFARDIAIWYDEFLIPGENYNDFIKRALEKSSLFVLTVTPNVVNENNYILKVEYPMALECGKKIAPVEMIPTDENELKKLCKDIPDMVSADNKEALAGRLKEELAFVSLNNSSDPKHMFFIGLAYLMGVDVEKNTEKAIEILKQSALNGLDEAMEKLSDIFYYGEGVPVDYSEALSWSNRLVDKYSDLAEENRKEDDIYKLTVYTVNYGERALSVKEYEKAERAFENTYTYSHMLAFKSVDKNVFIKAFKTIKKWVKKSKYYSDALYYMVLSGRRLVEINSDMGFVDAAAEWGMKIAKWGGAFRFVSDDIRITNDLLAVYGTLAVLCAESGNIIGAEQWFDKEKELVPTGDDYDSLLTGLRFLMHYCVIAENKNDLNSACEYTEINRDQARRMYEEHRTVFLLELTLDLQLDLIKRLEMKKDFDKAMTEINKLVGFINKLSSSEDAYVYDRYVSMANIYKGSILMATGQPGFDQAMEQGLEYINKMLDEGIDINSSNDVVYTTTKMGERYYRDGNYPEAAQWYEKAGTFITDTIAFTRSLKDIRKGAEIYERLYLIYIKLGYGMVATKWYDYALFDREAVYKSTYLQSDLDELNKLKSNRSALKGVHRAPQGVSCLIDVLKPVESSVAELALDMGKLEGMISEVIDFFLKTHPNLKHSETIWEVRSTIKKRQKNMNDDKNSLFSVCGRAAKVIVDNYRPYLIYNEEANLIATFCGYTDLKLAKKVIGGRDEAIQGLNNFFNGIPMLYYPLEMIDHKDLWQMLYQYICDEIELTNN